MALSVFERKKIQLDVLEEFYSQVENKIHSLKYEFKRTGKTRDVYDFQNHCPKLDKDGNVEQEDVYDWVRKYDNEITEADYVKLDILEAIKELLDELV